MGNLIKFTCGHCGYSAEVSGGKGYGMNAIVQTMICKNCNELVDILIGLCGRKGKIGDPDYDKDLVGGCPECCGKDLLTWDESKSCPKCQGGMTEGDVTADWD